jgi:hypothetical protein
MKDKKWKLATWGMIAGTVLMAAGVLGWFMGAKDGYVIIIGEGAGLMTLVLSAYITGNVYQKKAVGKYYQPVMDANNPSTEYLQYSGQ